MSHASVVTKNKVYLGGHQYTISGPVQRQVVSQAPQQFRLGDISQDSHPLASITSWSDQRGGIGMDVLDGGEESLRRCWFSTCSLRHKGHLVLQRLATQTTVLTSGAVNMLAELASKMYAISGASVIEYANATDTWTIKATLGGSGTDAITIPLGGTKTLVIARTTGVDYSTDGTTWLANETGIKYLTYWRDLLFGMGSDGKFYFTSDLSGSWTEITTFYPANGDVTDLFVGPSSAGEEIIYAAANDGLYAYDNATERFVKTQLAVPFHPTNGFGCVAWRNSIYFPAGHAIYRYTPGQVNVVDLVGPDRDDGLPETNQGVIKHLVTTHNDLIAIVGPTSQVQIVGTRAFRGATAGPSAHRGAFSGAVSTASAGAVKGLVLGWDTRGWEVKWQDDSAEGSMQAAIVSYAYNQYRLWWAAGGSIYYMALPVGIVNPNRVSTTAFAATGTWETPWYTADIIDFDKTALSIYVDSSHPSSSETITFSRSMNYDDNSSAFTTIAVKNTSGDAEYFLPSDTTPEGVEFRSVKFKAAFARGSTTTNSPDLKRLGFVYRKRVQALYGFVFKVNMRENTQNRTWREQRDNLEAAYKSKKLLQFTYRDERDSEQLFWVQMTGLAFLDNTGTEESNLAQVAVTEIH